ncbi:MAG: D-glycero-beta-D-manno-heptose 1-phosphate adenylyltransferase, partial [Deltaproteobacteria bacterium]|nr:D-glycero-beta-D-manno-heptose 1-phosphate adenylyltransferase [Deltaproteobacteria bacterium]
MTSYLEKIKSLEQAKAECIRLKAEGKRVVFTNGCFDILHPGHAR